MSECVEKMYVEFSSNPKLDEIKNKQTFFQYLRQTQILCLESRQVSKIQLISCYLKEQNSHPFQHQMIGIT